MADKEKRLEVRLVGDRATHVPFGVWLGRMLVSRHGSESDALRIRDKLNAKIERRQVLEALVEKAVANVRNS